MYLFKFKPDKKGDFYSDKDYFELEIFDLIGPDPSKKQITLKLTKPKDTHIKTLTFTLNGKTRNVEIATGKLVKTGPFPLVEGKNPVKFEGTSDSPDEVHEIELVPLWLS